MEIATVKRDSTSISQLNTTKTGGIKWYMETEDTQICLEAKETCVRMRESLLELLGDDFDSKDSLENTTNADELADFVALIQERAAFEKEDAGFIRQLVTRLETVCIFAEKITQVVQVMVPQDPKFTIPYGCLALLFKAVAWNKERKEKLDGFLVNILEVLPVAEAYAELFPTRQIKEVLACMYVSILEFLGKATIYFRRNNLKRAVDGLFKPTSTRFEIYMKQLEQYTARLTRYQKLASAAQQDETLKSVKEISGTLTIVRQEMELMSQEMFTKINQVENLWKDQQKLAKKDRILSAHRELSTLAQLLLPNSKPWESELRCAREQNPEISQRSHRQMQGVIQDLSKWSETVDDRPLLWLSVTAGNQGTWVTQMITEYQASWAKGDVQLLCVFVGIYRAEQLTARCLISLLIIRTMEIFPTVIFEMPKSLNTRMLAQATVPELWEILDGMIRLFGPVLMIIDRIDLCNFHEETGQWPRFLENMEEMVSGQKGDLRVLFTSADKPPHLVEQAELFETMHSSARIKPHRRYER